ncbi:neurogenic locus notch-like protein 1-like [Senna tora]|uniref:Neurogenic locus notch-like protein 1-like n=1 Tax=Senna tora TaxID=362788 RepID=A0A834TI49_9FABA|nr:neurogenic locus notch-like protein 1-like [Senna tora]
MDGLRLLGLMVVVLVGIGKGDVVDDLLGRICEEVECGKGKCVANSSLALGFMCECDDGWARIRDDDDNQTHPDNFLPCVIPQCSLNYGCQPAPPPVSDKAYPYNLSAFDRTIGSDCSKLGIKVADSTTSDQAQANSMVAGRLQWMVMLFMSTGVAMWT